MCWARSLHEMKLMKPTFSRPLYGLCPARKPSDRSWVRIWIFCGRPPVSQIESANRLWRRFIRSGTPAAKPVSSSPAIALRPQRAYTAIYDPIILRQR